MNITHPASMTADQREAARHKPANFDRVALPDGGAVYLDRDRCSAVAYAGRAIRRAWAYRFSNETHRAGYVAAWVEGQQSTIAARAERAKVKAAPHTLQAGDVLYSSWGYDQTNIDFYQVTRTSPGFVWIREIGQQRSSTGDMTGVCVPVPGKFIGDETRHRVNATNYVRIRGYSTATKIEPIILAGVTTWQPHSWSSYA